MKKNRKYILLLLLLMVVASLFFFLRKPAKEKLPVFTQQGQTDINAGNIVMKVWDNEAEDGDTVQVYFKNRLIADTLGILNTPVEYKLGHLSAGEYWLGVKAISEGMNSPASVSVGLSDGKAEKEFIIDARVDSASSWKIIVH